MNWPLAGCAPGNEGTESWADAKSGRFDVSVLFSSLEKANNCELCDHVFIIWVSLKLVPGGRNRKTLAGCCSKATHPVSFSTNSQAGLSTFMLASSCRASKSPCLFAYRCCQLEPNKVVPQSGFSTSWSCRCPQILEQHQGWNRPTRKLVTVAVQE